MPPKNQPSKGKRMLSAFWLFLLSTTWILVNGWNALPIGAFAALFLRKRQGPLRHRMTLVLVGCLVGFVGTGPVINVNIGGIASVPDNVISVGAGAYIGLNRLAQYLPRHTVMRMYTGGISPETERSLEVFAETFVEDFNEGKIADILRTVPLEIRKNISEDTLRSMERTIEDIAKVTGPIQQHEFLGYDTVDIANNPLPPGYLSALYRVVTKTPEASFMFLTAKLDTQPAGFVRVHFYPATLGVEISKAQQ